MEVNGHTSTCFGRKMRDRCALRPENGPVKQEAAGRSIG